MSDLLNEDLNLNSLSTELVDMTPLANDKVELVKLFRYERLLNPDKEHPNSMSELNKIKECLINTGETISINSNVSTLEYDLNKFVTKFLESWFNQNISDIDLDRLEESEGRILTAKEALTIQLHEDLKKAPNLYEFLNISKNILSFKGDSFDMLNKSIDKYLFVKLTVDTALNDPPTNCLAIAENTDLQHAIRPFFDLSTHLEYLQDYSKSAQRELLENLFKIGKKFDQNSPLTEEWEFLAEVLIVDFENSGVLSKVSFFRINHPQEYFKTIPGFIEAVFDLESEILKVSPMSQPRHSPYLFAAPSPYNRTKLEYIDEIFLSAVSLKDSNDIPKYDLTGFTPEIVKKRLVSVLPKLIQSMIYLQKDDYGFIEDLGKMVNTSSKNTFITPEYIQRELIKIHNNYLFNYCKSLVFDRLRSVLINSCGFSRKEVSNFFADIDDYMGADYLSSSFDNALDRNFLQIP